MVVECKVGGGVGGGGGAEGSWVQAQQQPAWSLANPAKGCYSQQCARGQGGAQ
jgi:hypothetical protein